MRPDIYARDRDLAAYKEEKLRMLTKDFKIRLTKADRERINAQTTEISVDNCVRSIINKKLK